MLQRAVPVTVWGSAATKPRGKVKEAARQTWGRVNDRQDWHVERLNVWTPSTICQPLKLSNLAWREMRTTVASWKSDDMWRGDLKTCLIGECLHMFQNVIWFLRLLLRRHPNWYLTKCVCVCVCVCVVARLSDYLFVIQGSSIHNLLRYGRGRILLQLFFRFVDWFGPFNLGGRGP